MQARSAARIRNVIHRETEDFTCELPFWSILAPNSYTELCIGHCSIPVDLFNAHSKVSPSSLDCTIIHPLEIAEGLGHFLVWSVSETIILGLTVSFSKSQPPLESAHSYKMPVPVLSKIS